MSIYNFCLGFANRLSDFSGRQLGPINIAHLQLPLLVVLLLTAVVIDSKKTTISRDPAPSISSLQTCSSSENCDEDKCPMRFNLTSPIIKMASQNPHFVKTVAGVQMPKLIYGTAWKKERTTDLVVQAVRAGFRGVDTACQPKHYHEPGVGEALKILSDEDGIKREDLFIQTKYTSVDGQDMKTIPYDPQHALPDTVKESLQISLKNLGTNYIDSLVMHSPMRTHRDTMEVSFNIYCKEAEN